jgi:hypothetical protein
MQRLNGEVVDEDLFAQVVHVPDIDHRQHPPPVAGRALRRNTKTGLSIPTRLTAGPNELSVVMLVELMMMHQATLTFTTVETFTSASRLT